MDKNYILTKLKQFRSEKLNLLETKKSKMVVWMKKSHTLYLLFMSALSTQKCILKVQICLSDVRMCLSDIM
jgi:hypothetical protein